MRTYALLLVVAVATMCSGIAFSAPMATSEVYTCEAEVQFTDAFSPGALEAVAEETGGTAQILSGPDASGKAVASMSREVFASLRSRGVACRYLRGITTLDGAAATGSKVIQFRHGSSSEQIPLMFSLHSGSIAISGAPAGATVTRIDLHIQGFCTFGDYLEFALSDVGSVHQYNINTSSWFDEAILDETIVGITGLNGLPVNQSWVLWGMSNAGAGGEYVSNWDITVYYDDGQQVGADLTVQSSDCAPLEVLTGSPLALSATVKNLGASPSVFFAETWYIATHVTPNTSDPVLYTRTNSGLGSGQTDTFTQNVTAPTVPGRYYAALMADSGNADPETNENNNWGQVFTLVVKEPNVLKVRPLGFIKEGATVTMTAPAGANYLFKKNGVAIVESAHMSGTNTRTLTIDGVELGDAGNYTCAYDDGIKAATETVSFHLTVFPAGSLPVLGAAGMAALAGLLASIGAHKSRKKMS
jgi:hypothetical protein